MCQEKVKEERQADQLRGIQRSINRLMAKGFKLGYTPDDELAKLARHAAPLMEKVIIWRGGRVIVPLSVKRLAGPAG